MSQIRCDRCSTVFESSCPPAWPVAPVQDAENVASARTNAVHIARSAMQSFVSGVLAATAAATCLRLICRSVTADTPPIPSG